MPEHIPYRHIVQAKPLARSRIITHVILGSVVVLLYLGIAWLIPVGKQYELLIIALGYLSLLLVGVTLVIGPLNLLRARRNPVNIDLRRDVGIWAAITGVLHVLLVIRGNIRDGEALLYFLRLVKGRYLPLLTLYGWSNDAGLFATLLLLFLLTLSNTLSLRLLKGKRWKWLQRLAYLLMLLSLAHTFGYQHLNLRGSLFIGGTIVLSLVILVCQGWGILLTLTRRKRKSRIGV